MKLTERIERDGIESDAELTDEKTTDGWHHRHYEVTLTLDGREMAVDGGFQAGMGHPWPETADVLASLLSVARRVEESADYAEWAQVFQSDPEKWQSERVYEDQKRVTQALRTFLGDAYDAYLNDTDDDT